MMSVYLVVAVIADVFALMDLQTVLTKHPPCGALLFPC